MRRVLCLLLIGLVGCNGITSFRFTTFQPTHTLLIVDGFVSSVQLTSILANGIFIDVTIVTFLHAGASSTVTFCDDFLDGFFLDAFTRVTFFGGLPCATVVDIVVN
jgi:hypothetical protein